MTDTDQARRIIDAWITRHTGMNPMQRNADAWATRFQGAIAECYPAMQDALDTITRALTPLADTLTKETRNDRPPDPR